MVMHTVALPFVSLLLLANISTAFAAPCTNAQLTTFKRLEGDFVENGNIVMEFFDRALSGEISCNIESTPPDQPKDAGGSIIGGCGTGGDTKFKHLVSLMLPNNTISFRIREEYDCGPAFWIEDISSDRGGVIQLTTLGKKTLGLLRQKACSVKDDYKNLRFKSSSRDGFQGTSVLKVISTSESSCADQTVIESIIEL